MKQTSKQYACIYIADGRQMEAFVKCKMSELWRDERHSSNRQSLISQVLSNMSAQNLRWVL